MDFSIEMYDPRLVYQELWNYGNTPLSRFFGTPVSSAGENNRVYTLDCTTLIDFFFDIIIKNFSKFMRDWILLKIPRKTHEDADFAITYLGNG